MYKPQSKSVPAGFTINIKLSFPFLDHEILVAFDLRTLEEILWKPVGLGNRLRSQTSTS